MKKFTIVMFLVVTTLFGLDVGVSYSDRSAKIDGNPFDYEIAFEAKHPKVFYFEIEWEREEGKIYNNIDVGITQQWEYVECNLKKSDVESKCIDIIQVDLRVKYKIVSAGIAQQWNSLIPETKGIVGISFNKNLIEIRADFLTNNFKEWDVDTFMEILYPISERFSIFAKGNIKIYGDMFWQRKIGIKYKIGWLK